ncbi:hypothetical protein AB6O49_10530 [Streptomyces sp. SBR177]
MTLVMAVLVGFVLVPGAFLVFGLMQISGESHERKRIRRLCESGVVVQARLISLVPFGTRGYASATYEFDTPTAPSATTRAPPAARPTRSAARTRWSTTPTTRRASTSAT